MRSAKIRVSFKIRFSQCNILINIGCFWIARIVESITEGPVLGRGYTIDNCCLACQEKRMEGLLVRAIFYFPTYGSCRCITGTYTTRGHGAYRYANLEGTGPGKCDSKLPL